MPLICVRWGLEAWVPWLDTGWDSGTGRDLWHLVVDCRFLEPCLCEECTCWGDFWSRVLVERAQGLEEGEGGSNLWAACLPTCLRPCAFCPPSDLDLFFLVWQPPPLFKALLCVRHCTECFTHINSFNRVLATAESQGDLQIIHHNVCERASRVLKAKTAGWQC